MIEHFCSYVYSLRWRRLCAYWQPCSWRL